MKNTLECTLQYFNCTFGGILKRLFHFLCSDDKAERLNLSLCSVCEAPVRVRGRPDGTG